MRQNNLRRASLGAAALIALGGMLASAQGPIYHAKVVIEGDTPTPSAPRVVAQLSTRLVPMCALSVFANGTIEYQINWRSREYDAHDADVCPVTISLAGYQTTPATLRNGAVIVLKRLGDHESATVSMTSLNAPKEAKKALDKAEAEMSQGKWEAARKQLEKAVEIYPQYARAWCSLGETLGEQHKGPEARAAWQKAIGADPKYLKSYLQLARFELQEGHMNDALAVTTRAIELTPIEYPGIYFFDAVANFNLKRLDAAEKSVRLALAHDGAHEIPRAEGLLGAILANRGHFAEAIDHLKKYLERAPNAPDAAEVRRQIAVLERRVNPGP